MVCSALSTNNQHALSPEENLNISFNNRFWTFSLFSSYSHWIPIEGPLSLSVPKANYPSCRPSLLWCSLPTVSVSKVLLVRLFLTLLAQPISLSLLYPSILLSLVLD